MTSPPDDPFVDLATHLRRAVGSEIRRGDLDSRHEADLMRRERRSISEVLRFHRSRGDQLRIVLDADDYTLEGHVLQATPSLVALTLVPDGIRVDLSPSRIALVEPTAKGSGHQPAHEGSLAATLVGRLRDLQRTRTPVEVTLAGGRRKSGVLAVVANDHLQLYQSGAPAAITAAVPATTIRLTHILEVRTHLKDRPRWEHQ